MATRKIYLDDEEMAAAIPVSKPEPPAEIPLDPDPFIQEELNVLEFVKQGLITPKEARDRFVDIQRRRLRPVLDTATVGGSVPFTFQYPVGANLPWTAPTPPTEVSWTNLGQVRDFTVTSVSAGDIYTADVLPWDGDPATRPESDREAIRAVIKEAAARERRESEARVLETLKRTQQLYQAPKKEPKMRDDPIKRSYAALTDFIENLTKETP